MQARAPVRINSTRRPSDRHCAANAPSTAKRLEALFPILISAFENVAVSAASAMWSGFRQVPPLPNAIPFTAAIIGLGKDLFFVVCAGRMKRIRVSAGSSSA